MPVNKNDILNRHTPEVTKVAAQIDELLQDDGRRHDYHHVEKHYFRIPYYLEFSSLSQYEKDDLQRMYQETGWSDVTFEYSDDGDGEREYVIVHYDPSDD